MGKKSYKPVTPHLDLAGPSAHLLSEAEVEASMEAVSKHDICCELYGEATANLNIYLPHSVSAARVFCSQPNLSSTSKVVDYAEMELKLLASLQEDCPEALDLLTVGTSVWPDSLPKTPEAIPKIVFGARVNKFTASVAITAKRVTHEPATFATTISFETCEKDPEFVQNHLKTREKEIALQLAGQPEHIVCRTPRFEALLKSPAEFVKPTFPEHVLEGIKMMSDTLGALSGGYTDAKVSMKKVAQALKDGALVCDTEFAEYGKYDSAATQKVMEAMEAAMEDDGPAVKMWDSITDPAAQETGITGEGYKALVRYGVRLKG